MSSLQTKLSRKPVQLGVLADIQYADKQDSIIEYVDKIREYQKVLPKISSAVSHLNEYDLSAVLHLGDIVDGNETLEKTRHDMDQVLERLQPLKAPVLHVLGNHCLDAGRDYLHKKFDFGNIGYYYRDVSERWRIIVLDTVDVSVERSEEHEHRALADEYLEKHAGEANAQEWNGGLGPVQVTWLKKVLEETQYAGKFAVVCGHLPILKESASAMHCIWDAEKLEEVLVASGVVKAYFCGHYHKGGYAEQRGVHHVTFEALLDSGDEGAAGVIKLLDDAILVEGVGTLTSRQLKF